MSKLAKLSPLVTTICSVLVLGLTFWLMSQRNSWRASSRDFQEKFEQTDASLKNTQSKLSKTSAELEATKKTLDETSAELNDTKGRLADTEDRAERLEGELRRATAQLEDQTRELAQAREEAAAAKSTASDLTAKVTSLNTQVRALTDENRRLEELLARTAATGGKEVTLPPGLTGKVLLVDRTWNFVVLDIGSAQGALPGGRMIVGRGQKSVGIVRLTSVLATKSIADIVSINDPRTPIQTGDEVLARE